MELKYYIGLTPYFVDGKQFIDWCADYYDSIDGKTCYGFDSEGNYYVAKRIDAISPLMTFEQNSEGGINVVMTLPGEKPVVERADGDMTCSTYNMGENSIFFFTNHMRSDKENPIKWSNFDVYVGVFNRDSYITTVTKVGTTSEFWFSDIE